MENGKDFNEFMDKVNTESKTIRYTLMKEGIEFVNPEVVVEWVQFVENNGTYIRVIKAVIAMMKKFEQNISFEEAQKQVFEEFGLRGYEIIEANQALLNFSKKSAEYRKFMNEQSGIEYDEGKTF